MAKQISKARRRVALVVNYSAQMIFLACLYLTGRIGWSLPIVIVMVVSGAVAVSTFVLVLVRTKLWRLVHTRVEQLDERELQVTHESLRYAYGFYAVISLSVLLVVALSSGQYDSLLILIFVSLLYLAHSLPAWVIAWREKS